VLDQTFTFVSTHKRIDGNCLIHLIGKNQAS